MITPDPNTTVPVSEGRDTSGDDAGIGTIERRAARPASCSESNYMQIVWSLDRSSDVGRALLAATRRLKEAGSETAQLDAVVLLGYVLGVNKAWLYAHPSRSLSDIEISQFEALVRRRMRHEPVAYLVGFKPFFGLDITVDSRVLIPRPETEVLVERVLAAIQRRVREGQRPKVADIGTGSGAIAVALAINAPELTVYAVDISEPALEVATQNIWRYGVGEQVHLAPGHLIDGVPEPVDIIAANLPYVATEDIPLLDLQIRAYEPVLALDGGPRGLLIIGSFLDAIASPEGRRKLRPGAQAFLEIGSDQGREVMDLVRQMLPSANAELLVDYAGLDRIVVIDFPQE